MQEWTEQVKNPNWQEVDQLALYKRSRGVEPGTTWNKSSRWSERDLKLGLANFKSGTLTTQSNCLRAKSQLNMLDFS